MRGLFVDTINLELDLVGHLAGIILEVLRAGSEIDLRMILSLVVVVFVVVVVMLAVLVIVAGGDGMVMVCCIPPPLRGREVVTVGVRDQYVWNLTGRL